MLKPTPQVFCQCESGRVTALWILLDTFEANRGQVPIYFRIPQARLPRLGFQNQPDSFVSCSANKRSVTGEQVVEDRTESVNIRGTCKLGSVASSLFGSHVTRRTEPLHHCARNCAFSLNEPCKTEISQMRLAVCIYQNVPWLNISVQDPSLMGIGNSARQLDDEFGSTPIRHWLTLDYFIESSAFDELHTKIAGTIAFPDLMNRNDVRVVQARCRFRLETKPFDVRFGGPASEPDNL